MISTPFFPIKNGSLSDNPSSPSGPLDPEVVYRQTRPSDWLKMPDVSEAPGNLYALVLIPQGAKVYFPLNISGSEVKVEYGYTDSEGSFISTRVASEAAFGRFDGIINSADFGNVTSDGHVQCMVRVSYQSGEPAIYFVRPLGDSDNLWVSPVREIACNVCNISLGGYLTAMKLLRYFYGKGFPSPFFMFYNNISLIAVRHLEMTSFNQAYSFFKGCISLIALPQIDTSTVIEFQNMFEGCISLEYIPELDISSAWSVESLFQDCSALKVLPVMDTSSISDFSMFLKGCTSIKEIRELDTSNGNYFDEMFSGCISLRSIPAINTSKATSMTDMFRSCHALTSIPPLHTDNIENITLFRDSGITSLPNLPISNEARTLSFENMNALCRVTLSCGGWDGCDISFSGTCLSREAYVELFLSLPAITGEYAITLGSILGGANALTTEDRAIATDKGWLLE